MSDYGKLGVKVVYTAPDGQRREVVTYCQESVNYKTETPPLDHIVEAVELAACAIAEME